MFIVLIVLIFMIIYIICNRDCSVRGGNGHTFSPIFTKIEPIIDKSLLREIDNKRITDVNARRGYIEHIYKTTSDTFIRDTIDKYLRNIPDDELPKSAGTIAGSSEAENVKCIIYAIYCKYNIKWNNFDSSAWYYINDLLNYIDYRYLRPAVRINLLKQIETFKEVLDNNVDNEYIRYLINDAEYEQPIATFDSILGGLRTEFYAIYNSNPTFLKDKNIKRKDYKRLLERAKKARAELKSIGISDEQDRLFLTLYKRIEYFSYN